jgi:hypothetical protein
MPKRIKLSLTTDEKAQLERWAKNPPKPYLRERARALLRIAQGEPIYQVAQTLRTPVQRQTVRAWVVRFETARCAGLKVRAGRGRKPVFSPSTCVRRVRPLDDTVASATCALRDPPDALAVAGSGGDGGVVG